MADTKRALDDLLANMPLTVPSGTTLQDLRDALVSIMPTGRPFAKVVASSTASDLQRFNADQKCDGTGDDTEISIVIAELV